MAENKKSDAFNYKSFKSEIINVLKGIEPFKDNLILGFSRENVSDMIQNPHKYRKNILMLSEHMYLKSGYYKRLIDYFANQAVLNYTVETKILSSVAYEKPDKVMKNLVKFSATLEKLGLKSETNAIFKRLFKNDVCYAYMVETEGKISYFYLDPLICDICTVINGNVFGFCIDKARLGKRRLASLPDELREYIESSPPEIRWLPIPPEKSLCLKYNCDFPFPYPPFLMMIADILLIDDYKDIAKTQSINDAYKLLTMQIPTDNDGHVTLDDGLITSFVKIVMSIVQENIGVITTPFKMGSEEFSTSGADDRDTVSDAISWAFKNVGVSEALMSGASSGSELKLSITNDSGDIFRIYRQIESWVSLQTELRGHVYKGYEFTFDLLNMTTFNESEVKDEELKMSQNGLPNKLRLAAANGLSPSSVMGNSFVENKLLADMFASWSPLKTSYTQSGADDSGRPKSDDGSLSASGEATRNNDTNNPDNRL